MLERFLEQQPAVFATLMSREVRKGEEVNTLNEKDICNAEDIVRLMAPVKVVTTILCEDEMPTVSMIAPLRAKPKKHFEAADEDIDFHWEAWGVQRDPVQRDPAPRDPHNGIVGPQIQDKPKGVFFSYTVRYKHIKIK